MSRFVEVEANLINVDYIVRVRQHKNYALSIYLDNGNVIKTDYACERVLEAIMGRNFIVGTVPCEGVSVAIDNGEGDAVLSRAPACPHRGRRGAAPERPV